MRPSFLRSTFLIFVITIGLTAHSWAADEPKYTEGDRKDYGDRMYALGHKSGYQKGYDDARKAIPALAPGNGGRGGGGISNRVLMGEVSDAGLPPGAPGSTTQLKKFYWQDQEPIGIGGKLIYFELAQDAATSGVKVSPIAKDVIGKLVGDGKLKAPSASDAIKATDTFQSIQNLNGPQR
jgi:hypothetical protein